MGALRASEFLHPNPAPKPSPSPSPSPQSPWVHWTLDTLHICSRLAGFSVAPAAPFACPPFPSSVLYPITIVYLFVSTKCVFLEGSPLSMRSVCVPSLAKNSNSYIRKSYTRCEIPPLPNCLLREKLSCEYSSGRTHS